MRVEVLNTGNELLLGEIVNTHGAYLGGRFHELGLQVVHQQCVPDGDPVRRAVGDAFRRCDVLVVTGGLGPTSDDLTRDAVAELLGLPMSIDEAVVAQIEARLSRVGVRMPSNNLRQAEVPEGAEVLENPNGTAPGLYLPAGIGRAEGMESSPHIFLLPGPPRELYPMFDAEVEPRVRRFAPGVGDREKRLFKIFGLGESRASAALERRLGKRLDAIELGYRLGPGDINLRLTGAAADLDDAEPILRRLFARFLVSDDEATLEDVVIRELLAREAKVTCAESCTGGLLASRFTDVSGSSGAFDRSFVTYSNASKSELLGVPAELIEEQGAVSEPVARAMAEGALAQAGADHALAITGIAGPTGGSDEKPVGTVFVALASAGEETFVGRYLYAVGRDRFKLLVTCRALDLLRRRLVGISLNR